MAIKLNYMKLDNIGVIMQKIFQRTFNHWLCFFEGIWQDMGGGGGGLFERGTYLKREGLNRINTVISNA